MRLRKSLIARFGFAAWRSAAGIGKGRTAFVFALHVAHVCAGRERKDSTAGA